MNYPTAAANIGSDSIMIMFLIVARKSTCGTVDLNKLEFAVVFYKSFNYSVVVAIGYRLVVGLDTIGEVFVAVDG